MGIVDKVKGLFGRSGDADEGVDADEAARRKAEEAERAYEHVNADLERDRNKAYERLTDVDGGRYS